jgi:hypothetical protein
MVVTIATAFMAFAMTRLLQFGEPVSEQTRRQL